MIKEINRKIEFEGFIIDIFLCDDGDLGLTIEKASDREDNPSVDIFVDKKTLKTWTI